jgi:Ca-activated chloride channel family protein
MTKNTVFLVQPVSGKAWGSIALCLFRFPFKVQLHPKSIYLAFALVLLASGSALAQREGQIGITPVHEKKSIATFALHVDEVELPFVVVDKHHHWITDLSQDEIRVRDNGLPPKSIRIFESRSGLPLRMGLIFDTSDSILQQFKEQKDIAALFIRRLVDPAKDLAFVLKFSTEPVLVQDLTSDPQTLAMAVQKLTLGGSTAIYDAVYFACKRLLQQQDEGYTRRVLVLLTDGNDNSSHMQPGVVIQEALRQNVVVLVLDTSPDPPTEDVNHRNLEKLAKVTGGQMLRAGNKKQLAKALGELSSYLRSYYLLAYNPAQFARDGSYHSIHLKATRRGVRTICRSGYYADRDTGE